MNKTALMVREMAIKPEVTVLDEHQKRLERVLGREVVKRTLLNRLVAPIEDFYKLNFRVIVTPKFALRFRYSASILGNCVGRNLDELPHGYGFYLKTAYHYMGDIPDFALKRIEVIKKKTQGRGGELCITVHSMEVLPITTSIIPLQIEPVAIWWAGNPLITKANEGWVSYNPDIIGAVIAIWDRDKEIEILEG